MTDLEILTGTLAHDDTVLLAELIEQRGDKWEIIKYGSYCGDAELVDKIRRMKNDTHKVKQDTTSEVYNLRRSIKGWRGRF